MRKRFVCGNWKMNKTESEARSYMAEFIKLARDNIDIVIAPPFTLLRTLKEITKNTNIKVAAQDIFFEDQGAYTGEISAKMIKDFADYVIIGHSERRKYFNETDETVNKKINTALKNSLSVIFCLGETLAERNKKITKKVVERQLKAGLRDISDINKIIIAYEPVWAIGTGKNATPEEAQEVHKFLREIIADKYNKKVAEDTRIIYGGSVIPENAAGILKMPDVDGCLPGGASLDPKKFAGIIESF